MHLDVQVVSEDTLDQLAPVPTARARSPLLVIEAYHPSARQQRHGTTTQAFRAREGVDYAEGDAKNRALGRAGECLVLYDEMETLSRKSRPDLAPRVRHVSGIEDDGAGYDVLSFTEDGTVKYIEVTTPRGPGGDRVLSVGPRAGFCTPASCTRLPLQTLWQSGPDALGEVLYRRGQSGVLL
jgi:hypothetical protein